ncbi:FtsK/SpoIIIE domain-containing protein [Pseudonocardia sp. T1-2H]|uniref:FtsK/SpoIIIE domain-containing protein n=1 Tax=Pseudonocardia sp. T1-2H TaxID=3128899 RepID=UPI0040541F07
MVAADVRDLADRLCPHLGCHSLRVESRGHGAYAVITLLASDPLAGVYTLPRGPITGPVLLARDEEAQDVTADLYTMPHTIASGQTGSGKSSFGYSLLAQAAERAKAGEPIRIAGVDPSSVTLRPFAGTAHAEHISLGLKDPARIERTLDRLVTDLDNRLEAMPIASDILPITDEHPLTLIVLEEWPATLRALDALDKKVAARVRGHVARLLAEARKVRMMVFMLVQRPEANLIGGAERAQLGLRLSFRSDSVESVRLLHSDADPAMAAGHSTALPGVALMSAVGRGLTRVRAPWLPYADYVRRVGGAAA